LPKKGIFQKKILGSFEMQLLQVVRCCLKQIYSTRAAHPTAKLNMVGHPKCPAAVEIRSSSYRIQAVISVDHSSKQIGWKLNMSDMMRIELKSRS